MKQYKKSGVDQDILDRASGIIGRNLRKRYKNRKDVLSLPGGFAGGIRIKKVKDRIQKPALFQQGFSLSGSGADEENFHEIVNDLSEMVYEFVRRHYVLPTNFLDYLALPSTGDEKAEASNVASLVLSLEEKLRPLNAPILGGETAFMPHTFANPHACLMYLIMTQIGHLEEFRDIPVEGQRHLFHLDLENYKNPVMLQSIDGIGTKVKLGFTGADLVNHCVNDVMAVGGRPAVFNFVFVGSSLSLKANDKIVNSFQEACEKENLFLNAYLIEHNNRNLVSGPDGVDVFGTITGFCDESKLITNNLTPGDLILGLPSSGPHTNGYSHINDIFEEYRDPACQDVKWDLKLLKALTAVHKSYAHILRPLLGQGLLKGVAHITGGGLPGNVKRILSKDVRAVLDSDNWDVPPVFRSIMEQSERVGQPISAEEMFEIYNMGVGMVLVIDCQNAQKVRGIIDSSPIQEECWELGRIEEGRRSVSISGKEW